MTHVVFFDGSISDNPGGDAGYGILITHNGKTVATEHGPSPKAATNNEAEYAALIEALHMAHRLKLRDLIIRGDSKLVINQMGNRWKIKEPRLRQLWLTAKHLLDRFDSTELEWCPRDDNWLADDLALKGRKAQSVITVQ
ncbi:hypothetical protein LCGC14_1971270 [marine sediment metagenome]|uniref:RNase H type-1 domain-containing protein n=1 Tax=marine sediment metagenome TaxID=412755 RepID=A0A0F9FZV6_9ZZZZ